MLAKFKTAFVLVVIAGLSGLLIYFVNEMTYQDIIDNAIAREEDFYKEIFDIDEAIELDSVKTDLDGLINQEVIVKDIDGNVYGIIYRGQEKNSYGSITVLVGVSSDDTIKQVVISGTDNTPNYVKKLTKSRPALPEYDIEAVPSFMDHFVGQDGANLTFDASTGASYSYGSVTVIVTEAMTLYESRGEGNE